MPNLLFEIHQSEEFFTRCSLWTEFETDIDSWANGQTSFAHMILVGKVTEEEGAEAEAKPTQSLGESL